jgi:hypothetical protein
MRSARLSRCVVLKPVARRDAAQRLSLAFCLLVREGNCGASPPAAVPGDAGPTPPRPRGQPRPRTAGVHR